MSVGCGRLVDRVLQAKLLNDFGRSEVEQFANLFGDEGVAEFLSLELGALHPGTVNGCTAVAVHKDADRAGHSDGVGNLHQEFVSHAGCHEIFGYVAGCVGCRAVHLGRVLAGESSTTVCSASAVGVDNDFASG